MCLAFGYRQGRTRALSLRSVTGASVFEIKVAAVVPDRHLPLLPQRATTFAELRGKRSTYRQSNNPSSPVLWRHAQDNVPLRRQFVGD